jgi:hypothetical protein
MEGRLSTITLVHFDRFFSYFIIFFGSKDSPVISARTSSQCMTPHIQAPNLLPGFSGPISKDRPVISARTSSQRMIPHIQATNLPSGFSRPISANTVGATSHSAPSSSSPTSSAVPTLSSAKVQTSLSAVMMNGTGLVV